MAEQGLAENVAASERIDTMTAEQKDKGAKSTSTLKKTCIVNGKSTVIETYKDGENVDSDVALPQPKPEIEPRAPRIMPSDYIPPHRRGKAAVEMKADENKEEEMRTKRRTWEVSS